MKLIRLPAVLGYTGYGRSMIYKLIKEGNFPKPVQLGTRAVAWVDEEVEAWVQGRVALSRPNPVRGAIFGKAQQPTHNLMREGGRGPLPVMTVANRKSKR